MPAAALRGACGGMSGAPLLGHARSLLRPSPGRAAAPLARAAPRAAPRAAASAAAPLAAAAVAAGGASRAAAARRRWLAPRPSGARRPAATSRSAGASRLGYSQRVENDEEDGPNTMVIDFTGAEERLRQMQSLSRTPITMLTGFLGAGKTTLLKHVLENQEGVRLGVVVNDVAAVNIDAQLIQRYERGGDIELAELSNGCVCCTATDDLVATVQDLVNRSGSKPFHHILIELSGVGEPEAIRSHWDIGVEVGVPVASQTEIKRTITVVDASSFGTDWLDSRKASERNEEGIEHTTFETVGQLLAEQAEKADVILINKVDLATEEELKTTEEVARALSPTGNVIRTTFGKVSPIEILPDVPRALRYPESGRGKNFRWAQSPEVVQIRVRVPPHTRARDVSFTIGRTWMEIWIEGEEVPRLQGKLFGRLRGLDEWLWELDGEGDDRHVAVFLEKSVPGMWEGLWETLKAGELAPPHEPGVEAEVAAEHGHAADAGHQHGHQHGHSHGQGHGHGHGDNAHGHEHDHGDTATSAERRFGIHTFVYRRRRPFSAERLNRVLDAWPLPQENKRTFTLQDLSVGEAPAGPSKAPARAAELLRPVLRSKGFCWLDSDPLKSHEWSHAGRSVSVLPKDWWWSVLTESQLDFQISYPGAKKEHERARRDNWDDEWGDRRQELVFIGGPEMREEDVSRLLDSCLLEDSELEAYAEQTEGLRPPASYFGVDGLLRKMGEDPESFGDMASGEAADDFFASLQTKGGKVIDADGFVADDGADYVFASLQTKGGKVIDADGFAADDGARARGAAAGASVPPVPPRRRRKAPPVPPRRAAREVAAGPQR